MPAKFNLHIAVVSLALIVSFPVASLGQTAPAAGGSATAPVPTKIGLIDILEAVQVTNEGQKELEDLGKKFVPKDAELKGLSEEIDRLKKTTLCAIRQAHRRAASQPDKDHRGEAKGLAAQLRRCSR